MINILQSIFPSGESKDLYLFVGLVGMVGIKDKKSILWSINYWWSAVTMLVEMKCFYTDLYLFNDIQH